MAKTIEQIVNDALANRNSPVSQRKGYDSTANVDGLKSINKLKQDIKRQKSKIKSSYGFNQDLDSSEGLYNLATKSGLQGQANKILKDNSGEDINQIFSGGFISDVFDVLNMGSYGVVGLLKGKSFEEGIKGRESFSDKDSLGQHGLTGVIMGTILDIAFDPFTYIAPWTVLKKVPGISKAGRAVGDTVFGKTVSKVFDETGRVHIQKEGGLGLTIGKKELSARRLAEKFSWMFGADPVFKETYERSMREIGIGTRKAKNMIADLGKVDAGTAENLFLREDILNNAGDIVKASGRFKRRTLDELRSTLDADAFEKVAPIWTKIDELSQELVDLGVVGKDKFAETFDTYLKSAYSEYELATKKGWFGTKPIRVRGTKARKDLTAEGIEKLGLIEDPQFLLLNTMTKQINDVENARLIRDVNKLFAADEAFEGSVKLADTRGLQTTAGATAELRTKVGAINKTIRGLEKDLKVTHKVDRKVVAEIKSLTKEMESISKLQGDELTKFLNEGLVTTKKVTTPRKLGTISEQLQPLASKIKKFDDFDQMMKSKAGLELEKLHLDGVLERQGFPGGDKAMRDFFEQAKSPFKKATTKEVTKELKGNIPRLIKLQRRVEKLASKKGTLSAVDKASINDSFINLEKNLFKAGDFKEELLDAINRNKMGDLAGKHVPKQIADYMDEIISPSDVMGNRVMGAFKYSKVILSPSTHSRNIVSNRILNWWKLGVGPWRFDLDAIVIKEFRTKGGGKWIKRAEKVGYGADTFVASEMKGFLSDPAVNKLGKKGKKLLDKIADIYQQEENYAKLTAFIHQSKKGLSDVDAWKAAESATFNYSEVTPFVRKLRTAIWGVPFVTFPLKATPVALETIAKHPTRVSVFGKIKNNIENLSDIKETAAERAAEPQWVKDGFYFKLPWKDSKGRSAYFDLTYIIPFGDILSGNLVPAKTSRKTGLKEPLPTAILSKNPAFQLLKELTTNKDFVGNKIYKESDPLEKATADMLKHMTKTFAPPQLGAQMSGGYNSKGEKVPSGIRASLSAKEKDNLKRTLPQELFSYFGMKVQPMNEELQESANEWNKTKGLRTLLTENGIIKDFSRSYIPK